MQYLAYVVVCVLGFVTAGLLGAFNANDWSGIVDEIDNPFRIIEDDFLRSRVQDLFILAAATSVSTACVHHSHECMHACMCKLT